MGHGADAGISPQHAPLIEDEMLYAASERANLRVPPPIVVVPLYELLAYEALGRLLDHYQRTVA